MKLLTPIIDTFIVVAVVAWGGALLWWWSHGLHSVTDAMLVGGLLTIFFTLLICLFSK